MACPCASCYWSIQPCNAFVKELYVTVFNVSDFGSRMGGTLSHRRPTDVWQGEVTFRLPSGKAVLEHLLKSGAGTVFYEAIDPARREALTEEFVRRLENRHQGGSEFEVIHEYVACIATRPS